MSGPMGSWSNRPAPHHRPPDPPAGQYAGPPPGPDRPTVGVASSQPAQQPLPPPVQPTSPTPPSTAAIGEPAPRQRPAVRRARPWLYVAIVVCLIALCDIAWLRFMAPDAAPRLEAAAPGAPVEVNGVVYQVSAITQSTHLIERTASGRVRTYDATAGSTYVVVDARVRLTDPDAYCRVSLRSVDNRQWSAVPVGTFDQGCPLKASVNQTYGTRWFFLIPEADVGRLAGLGIDNTDHANIKVARPPA